MLGTLLPLGGLALVLAQELRITAVKVDPTNRLMVEGETDPSSTNVLLKGTSVTNINTPAATNQAAANGLVQFSVPMPDAEAFFRIQRSTSGPSPLATIVETSPAIGESGVSVTRETIVRFSAPLAGNTAVGTNNFYATVGARRLLSRVELSSDRRTATLFYLEPLPGSTRIYAVFDGTGISDHLGHPLDADGDGQVGGQLPITFDTATLTPIAGTAIIGRVFRSDLKPGEVSKDNIVEMPLAGVQIEVIGQEQDIRTRTDAMGNFRLDPSPAGRFFVRIDGRTATNGVRDANLPWSERDYYPAIEKAWEAVAGRSDNLAGCPPGFTNCEGIIYLPLIKRGTLRPISAVQETVITFPPEVVAQNPALDGVEIMIPPNALVGENGVRGGMIGIAPVSPDRLPEPLPPGLNHVLDITVQTDGPQNFDRPVPVRFPNLPDPVTGKKLAPGEKSALWSFNHDKGKWEIVGSMTVSADGNFVETDPGVGIRQPGWHGSMPGVDAHGGRYGGGGGGGCGGCTTTCVTGNLSGGKVVASAAQVCAGTGFSFTANGVVDSGGKKITVCCSGVPCKCITTTTDIPPGPFSYKWEITRDGTVISSGTGPEAAVSNPEAGVYACRFTTKSQRECPPPDYTLPAGRSVTVGDSEPKPNDIDCDGISNGSDTDVDGDGIPNRSDPDIDGDGMPNNEDDDMDGDGIPNDQDPDPDGPDAECSISITGPNQVCVGQSISLHATENPTGGTLGWSIALGQSLAQFTSDISVENVTLQGIAVGEVTVQVTYQPPGVDSPDGRCTHTFQISVVQPMIKIVSASTPRTWDNNENLYSFISTETVRLQTSVSNACQAQVQWTITGTFAAGGQGWQFDNQNSSFSFIPDTLAGFRQFRIERLTAGSREPNEPVGFDIRARLIDPTSGTTLAESVLSDQPPDVGRLRQDVNDTLRQEYVDYQQTYPNSFFAPLPLRNAVNSTPSALPANVIDQTTTSNGLNGGNYTPESSARAHAYLETGAAQILNSLAEHFSSTIALTSGYRNPQRQNEVATAVDSRHQYGDAVDVRPHPHPNDIVDSNTRARTWLTFYNAARQSGAKRILFEPRGGGKEFVVLSGGSFPDLDTIDNATGAAGGDGLPDNRTFAALGGLNAYNVMSGRAGGNVVGLLHLDNK